MRFRYGNNIPLEVLRILFLREAMCFPSGHVHTGTHRGPRPLDSAEQASEPSK